MNERQFDDAFARLLDEAPPTSADLSKPVKNTVDRRRVAELVTRIAVCAVFAAVCGFFFASISSTAAAYWGEAWLVMVPLACIGLLVWAALIEVLTLCFARA
ncbi:MAG: hypothetical protein K2P70_04675 [Hyphomonadaceae bacterium]|nr:hypothetical protein [Hyphomonadaceae bacterium]